MNDPWCVLLNTGTDFIVYGPMTAAEAEAFAEFMTKTVDPAAPRKLASPTGEMLAWFKHETDRNSCTHDAGCEVHPLYCPPAPGMPGCTGDAACLVHPGVKRLHGMQDGGRRRVGA